MIAEYKGTVVLKEALFAEIEGNPPQQILCKVPSAFVLLPTCDPLVGFSTATTSSSSSLSSSSSGPVFAVDARTAGSPARFVRRSCSPNACVRVVWDKNKPRFGVS